LPQRFLSFRYPLQWTGQARLFSGLVLFTYVLSHNLNHAAGLISLQTAEEARLFFLGFWRFPPVAALFFTSALVHILLAFRSLYRRYSLRMPLWEALQLTLGLATPPLLAIHFTGTAIANGFFGVDDTYAYVVLALWVFTPAYGWQQAALVIVTWIHGCIGLHYWLRLKPWFPRWRLFFFAVFLLVPVLALLGFLAMGREVMHLAEMPRWTELALKHAQVVDSATARHLVLLTKRSVMIYFAAIAGVLALRQLRKARTRKHAIHIRYADGKAVDVQPGTSLLEASRMGNIPHASVCGGRGRCSTCRVRILAGADKLPTPSEQELRVLARIGAAPGTRLACQTRPTAAVTIMPLLPASAGPRHALAASGLTHGKEQEIAVLFADLRNFTQFAEQHLPYDVVFLLNRYFRAMGEAVTAAGGTVDKFIGDGVMALFGIAQAPDIACRQAVEAARRMAENLAALNAVFAQEIKTPLKIGIGIHAGPAIVGEMGYGQTLALTAIGDTVNTASRLESATKALQCELLISETAARLAGLYAPGPEGAARPPAILHTLTLRGRSQTMDALAFESAADLPR